MKMINSKLSKDNVLLVDFDFVIDMDIAILRYVLSKFTGSNLIDEEMLEVDDDDLKYCLLCRPNRNPLDVIFKSGIKTNEIYHNILEKNYVDIMTNYADRYDTFGLLYTFIEQASSVDIYIRCDTQEQSDLIKKIDKQMDTVISSRDKIDLNKYSVVYEKYLEDILKYNYIEGKHIYTAKAEFNKPFMLGPAFNKYAECNLIHFMDLYVNIKVDQYDEVSNNEEE